MAMTEAVLWFIGGGAVLALVLAYFAWAEVVLGDDEDAPAHVARRDWSKVSERRR